MAALTHHSHTAINDIISEMTRPISEILGEPPLTALEPRVRKTRRPVRPRSLDSPSDADIFAITSSYKGPEPFLQGGRVSGELCPPRKSATKKRRREEKPPRHDNSAKKSEGESLKKPRTDDVKVRPMGIKLTSQLAHRETSGGIEKKNRPSLAKSERREEPSVKETKMEARKSLKRERDHSPSRHSPKSKETTRKPRPSVPRKIPSSVIPRSQPRPLRSSSPEEPELDGKGPRAKAKTKPSPSKRLSIPRRSTSEAVDHKGRRESRRSAPNESLEESLSSPEQRRPRSRTRDEGRERSQDREYAKERRDKKRPRDSDKDLERDRERSERDRDTIRRSSMRNDREKDRAPGRESKTDRRSRDADRDRQREDRKLGEEPRRNSNRPKDRAGDKHREAERPILRSEPSPGSEPSSAEQSPHRGRGVSLSSKPIKQSGSSKSPTGDIPREKLVQKRHGVADLQSTKAKQKELQREYRANRSKMDDLWKQKDYDGYEEAAKRGFCLWFDLGLTMETELRLSDGSLRTIDAARKRPVIDHYKTLTKSYVPKRVEELKKVGRKEGSAFFTRALRKVFLRMFIVHNIRHREVHQTNKALQTLVQDTIKLREAGESNASAEEEIPLRKLKSLERLVFEHLNILSILEGIVTDSGSGVEEAGAEGHMIH